MENGAVIGAAIVAVIAIVALVFLATDAGDDVTLPGDDGGVDISQPPSEGEASGRAIFVITDAAADMGTVSEVNVRVERVLVHSDAEGWVEVTSDAKTYDLLELKAEGRNSLIADVDLSPGTYQQIRLDISDVTVVDAEGEHDAKLPSGELKLAGVVEVEENATATAVFDFQADESLHVTGNGEYILAPVVQLTTKANAEVTVRSQNEIEIRGGQTRTNTKLGMDISGNVGAGVQIRANDEISIGAGGGLQLGVGGGLGIGLGNGNDNGQGNGAQVRAEVMVESQNAADGIVQVEQVRAREDGWIVIHADDGGQPGAVIGQTYVEAGMNSDVSVEIDENMASSTLYAMLHIDAGVEGEYEFPGDDVPAEEDGEVVVDTFTVELESESEGEATVVMDGLSFSPATITVEQGTTVIWENEDDLLHTVVATGANTGLFASTDLSTGDKFSFTFENEGSYEYLCTIHPSMRGTVIVEGEASGGLGLGI